MGSLSCSYPDCSEHVVAQHSLCYIFSKSYLYLETPHWVALSLLLFPQLPVKHYILYNFCITSSPICAHTVCFIDAYIFASEYLFYQYGLL